MSDWPEGFFLTWTTYGTWLHGDERGWVESGTPGIRPPDPERREQRRRQMTSEPVVLTQAQRQAVEDTIRRHCEIRGWTLHAVNVRTNHIHVVLTALVSPETAMERLKAWCSRRLSELEDGPAQPAGRPEKRNKNGRRRWWTEHGSTKWINDEPYLSNAIQYVNERQ